MNKISRISRVLALFMIVIGGLGGGALADEDARQGRCSNRTLRGEYGFAIEGELLAGPKAGPLRGVAMTRFDGEGSLTQVDHVVNNGVPPAVQWRPSSGTYSINADCTGTATIQSNDGSPLVNLSLVVVKRGSEIHTVVEGPGAAVTSIGIERE
jgi:hypothetical protein